MRSLDAGKFVRGSLAAARSSVSSQLYRGVRISDNCMRWGTSLKALPKREVLEELEVLEPIEEMDLDDFDVKETQSDSEESYVSRDDEYDEDNDSAEENDQD